MTSGEDKKSSRRDVKPFSPEAGDAAPQPSQNSGPLPEGDFVQVPREEYMKREERLKELESLREKLLLSAADFDNAKKRLLKERDEFVKFSLENLIRQLLPLMDNFDRTLLHLQTLDEESRAKLKGVLMGVQMVQKQFGEVLKNHGVTRIKSTGEIFDPHKHEAVAHIQEPGREDEVVEEIEAGYFLHDRLLRAAKVKVRVSVSGSSGQNKSGQPADDKQEEIT